MNSYGVPCGTDSEQTYAQRAGLYEKRELPLALPVSEGRSVTGGHRGFAGRGTCLCQMKKGGQFGSERVYLMTRKRLVVPQRRREGACNRAAGANGTFCGKGGMTERYEKSPVKDRAF